MLLSVFSLAASAQETVTFGGAGDTDRQDRAYKLDVIDVVETVTLLEFEFWLDYDQGGGLNETESLTFAVYRENMPDDYVRVWDSGLVSVGDAPGFKSSGPVDLEIVAGSRVAIGVVFDDGNYWYHFDQPLAPLDVGWGSIAGAIWSPEDATQFVPNLLPNQTVDNVGYELRLTIETLDADGDGVQDDEDCAPDDPTRFPGAPEYCDGFDNDCTEVPDDNLVATPAFADADGDGYGGAATTYCEAEMPAGLSADGTDCDDGVASINPAGVEICDGLDQDCSGYADDGLPVVTWWTDADGDGAGDPAGLIEGCDVAPPGTVDNSFDCDDADAERFPGNEEACDGKDNDCDGLFGDEGDFDGDGAMDCEDCAADDPTRFPGATEMCDGTDYDCDGVVKQPLDCDIAPDEKVAVPGCGCTTGASGAPLAGLLAGLWIRRRRVARSAARV